MSHSHQSRRSHWFQKLFGQKRSRRQNRRRRLIGRVESLENRVLLHAGVDHDLPDADDHHSADTTSALVAEGESNGFNGPFTTDPAYNPAQSFHIHVGLTMYVNGQKVEVPVFTTNPADIHTHDATGAIHVHPQSARTDFVTLGEVFTSWRTAVSGANPNAVLTSTNLLNNQVDSSHTLQMFVNGVRTDNFEKYQLHDKDQILLVYGTNPIITINTNQGPIPVELFEGVTPETVENFLNYVNGGDFSQSVFHRYVPGFVLQGGGYKSTSATFTSANQITSIPTDPPVVNEFSNFAIVSGTGAVVTQGSTVIQLPSNANLSQVAVGNRIRLTGRTDGLTGSDMFNITAVNDAANTVTVSAAPTSATGQNVSWAIFPKVNLTNTLAMAKVGGNPNSATNQFFINLANNDSNLDLQNGGFTVFGRIFDVAQGQVTDSSTPANQLLNGSYTQFVSNLTSSNSSSSFNELPLAPNSQLVQIQSITGEGEVKGVVYSDLDLSGTKGQNETGRQGVTVYVDANNNQQMDTAEIRTVTDSTGNYALRLSPGQHRIRMVAVNGTTQSNPTAGYTVNVEIGRDVTARDFGVFSLLEPTGIDLVAASDSGSSNTDNVTQRNNSATASTLQFQVTGVADGATVQILSDGVVIGQSIVPSGSGGTITVTTNGTTTISDGTHVIKASQKTGDVTATMTNGISVVVDSAAPSFTSTVPFTANIGVPFTYDAQTNEDTAGVTYALQGTVAGVTVNATTGVVSCTPTTAQLGSQTFAITATDKAGNVATQQVALNVTKPPQVRIRLAVTDLSGNPITAINVGSTFQLQAFVSDARTNPTGANAAYHDVAWNGSVASVVAGSITRGTQYTQSPSGSISAGLLDEIGSTAGGTTGVGSGEFLLYKVNLKADSAGQLTFVGNAPDVAANNVTVFGSTTAVPVDEIDFGQASLTVRQVTPSSLAGFVYIDKDNDGVKDTGEQPVPNVTITLTGTDSFGAAVSKTATTQTDGSYKFDALNPGTYKLKETQPTGPINNLPIFEGKSTIGSQGGTATVLNEFSITLAEGVTGVNNNFGELVGHSVGGTVGSGNPQNGGSTGLVMPGVEVSLYATDSANKPVGNPIQVTTVKPDGTFAFPGLAANKYVVQVETPVFLQGGSTQAVLEVGNTDNVNNVLQPAGLQATFISYRDFLNSTPQQNIYAAVSPGTSGNQWTAFDQSWSGFKVLNLTLTSDATKLRIYGERTSGQAVGTEISVNDPRVTSIAQQGTTRLYRLTGGSSSFNLQPVTAQEGEGEAAASSQSVATNAAASLPANSVANSAGGAEGEFGGDSFDSTASSSTLLVLPESSTDQTDSLGSVVSLQDLNWQTSTSDADLVAQEEVSVDPLEQMLEPSDAEQVFAGLENDSALDKIADELAQSLAAVNSTSDPFSWFDDAII